MATLNNEDFNKWLQKNPSTLSDIYQKERSGIAKAIPSIFTSVDGFQLIYMVDPTDENKTLEIFFVVLSDSDLPKDLNWVTANNLRQVNESKLSVSVSELFIQVDKNFKTLDYTITIIPRIDKPNKQ
jgi:hypothetical protein